MINIVYIEILVGIERERDLATERWIWGLESQSSLLPSGVSQIDLGVLSPEKEPAK